MSRFPGWLLLLVLFSGCAETVLTQMPRKDIFRDYFRLQEVKVGMSRSEVEAIMGSPQTQEEGDFRQGRFIFYFYRTHNLDYEGSETVRGGFTPLIFQRGALVGMGRRDYFRAVDRPWGSEVSSPSWQRGW